MRRITIFRLSVLLLLIGYSQSVFATYKKLYVVTDKAYYSTGETVQFQIFLRDHSVTSNTSVFIELLDCKGNYLAKQMVPCDHLTASGSIILPDTDNAAFYILYFYTTNKDTVENSFTKKIFLNEKPYTTQEKKVSLSYFFEGGTFIAESPNNILLRCVDEDGNPAKVSGQIMDDKKQLYAWFETDAEGFAMVRVNPEDKVPCFIMLDDSTGINEKVFLPMASPTGVTLNIEAYKDSIIYTMLSYEPAKDKTLEYTLEVYFNGQLFYNASVSFQNGQSFVQQEMIKTDLPQGFLTFRIIDKARNICAQRVFYNAGDLMPENIIRIVDTIGKKEAKINLPDHINGKGYMKIISGSMNNADLYKELDPLINTGNTGFGFNSRLIAMKEPPLILAKDTFNRNLSLTGTLRNREGKPLKNRNVNLIILQKNLSKQFLISQTDDKGVLKINNLIFYDSVKIYYQLADKSEDKNNVSLDLEVSPSTIIEGKKIPASFFNCSNEPVKRDIVQENNNFRYLASDPKIKTMKEVIVKGAFTKKKTESEKFIEKNVSAQFNTSAFKRNEFDFIENPQVIDNISIINFIRSRFSGLLIRSNKWGDPTIVSTHGGVVSIYLNDMELTEPMDVIRDLAIRDVALIRYYSMSHRPKASGAGIGGLSDGGDLMIYTKNGFINADPKVQGLPKVSVAGYSTGSTGIKYTSANNAAFLYWSPNWMPKQEEIIYMTLPAANSGDTFLIIEGMNSLMAPFRFIKKLEFL